MRSPALLSLAVALLSAGCAGDDAAEDAPSVGGSIADSFETADAPPAAAPPPSVDADTSVSVEPPPDLSPVTAAERAPDGSAGACDGRTSGAPSCTTYTGPDWTAAAAESECGGAFLAAACSVQDRVATCAFNPNGDAAREVVATYYAGTDLATARATCPGTFTAF